MIHDLNISLEDLRLFYQVVSNGGYLKASKAINICQAKASRRVAHIEKVLGVQLLHCNMRELTLTSAGYEVFKMAEMMLGCANQTFTSVKTNKESMQGEVTLFSTTAFGGFCLTPWIAEFLEAYPLIRLRFGKDIGDTDLVLGEADIAISSTKPPARESLHSHLLCQYPLYPYASSSYLKRRNAPQTLQDLDHHALIAWGPIPDLSSEKVINALLYAGREGQPPREARVCVGADLAIATHASQGIGIALMPEFLAQQFPNLERIVLQDEKGALRQINQKYISYPKVLLQSKRHRRFIEFIVQKTSSMFGTNL